MSRKVSILVVCACVGVCLQGRADFKYTQTSQITGGAMAGMMKGLSIFSKSARQMTKPMPSTTYVKGNRLRRDSADGSYQIIDLDGQRIIEVDPQHQTYSSTTFEQMRDAVQKMNEQMNEEMKKQSHEKGANVTMTPKISINPTGKTQTILGQSAQEVDMKVGLQMQAQNTQQNPQSATFTMDMDSWVAPVSGYNEVSEFYKRMATEIGWSPNAAFGNNPQMMKSMVELYKSGKIPTGMPLLLTVSTLMEGQGGQPGSQQQTQQQSPSSASTSEEIASPGAAAAKALGGFFGHRRKKHQEEEQQNAAPQSQAPAGSLLTMTMTVTSYSTDSVDASLFQIPAGFTEIRSNTQRMLQTGH